MAEPIAGPSYDGQELEIPDWANVAAVAGLADDRVLAEVLRMSPYDGNVYKGIIPFGYRTALAAAFPGGTVASSGIGNASIVISPFRVVIGSRNAANAVPPGANPAQNFQPNALANWRDIRSGIFIGSSTALTTSIALAPLGGGNPRWDLVYATLSLDANGPSVTRRVKSPATSAVSSLSVPQWLQSPVSVSVIAGTPGASPALPAIPGDTATTYNVPLCYVCVPPGLTGSSTISGQSIRAFANATSNYMLPGSGVVEPASGSNDRTGTYAVNLPWNTGTERRSGVFLPPDMIGGKQIIVEVDCSNASSALWSHQPNAIVDASIDWRNRLTRTLSSWGGAGGGSTTLATDPILGAAAQGVPTVGPGPSGPGLILTVPEQFGNTFRPDGLLVSGGASVLLLFSTGTPSTSTVPLWATGARCGLYVNSSDGTLRWWGNTTGSPGCAGSIFALWVQASAAFPNP